MKSTSSFRTQRHPPTPLRIPKSFQFICLFIHSLFAVVKTGATGPLIHVLDVCHLEAQWGGGGGGDNSTLGQSQLWCNAVPSRTFGLCCQLCITYISSDIPQRCGDDGQHCNLNTQTYRRVTESCSSAQSISQPLFTECEIRGTSKCFFSLTDSVCWISLLKKKKESQNSNLKHRRSSLDPLNLLLASWKKKEKSLNYLGITREMWAMRLLRKSALCCEFFVLFCAARISFFARIKSTEAPYFFFVSACYSS